MNVQQAEAILLETGISIVLQHRFAGDRGTILRLDNYAMINIFDDGRYYIQGDDTGTLGVVFGVVEEPWNPESTTATGQEQILPWFPPPGQSKRFEM
jgi:hypothetical protein